MLKILRVITAIITAMILMGCEKVESVEPVNEPVNVSRFMTVENMASWIIVVDRETGVMYAVSMGMYNGGTFTLLVDDEGNPLIYKGGQN